MKKRLFYNDHHAIELPANHKFPITKYTLLREMLEAEGRFELLPAPLAELPALELVHGREYVRAFVNGEMEPAAMRRIGFPWSEGLVRRSLGSVGGTLEATAEAIETGWGGTLAGGTHHAFANEGSGFCVFNDIAVAIRYLQSGRGPDGGRPRKLLRRAAVIDLDVHQGDGTAHIFQDDANVLTLSIHCRNNFPLRKQRSKIDIEMAAGVEDQEYLDTLESVLPEVWKFGPDIVFYQSGVDTLASDTLGYLSLTPEGLKTRDRMVLTAAKERGVPLVITLGGGYSKPVELTAQAHANTFRTALEIFT